MFTIELSDPGTKTKTLEAPTLDAAILAVKGVTTPYTSALVVQDKKAFALCTREPGETAWEIKLTRHGREAQIVWVWVEGQYGTARAKIGAFTLTVNWDSLKPKGEPTGYKVTFAGVSLKHRFQDASEAKEAGVKFARGLVAKAAGDLGLSVLE